MSSAARGSDRTKERLAPAARERQRLISTYCQFTDHQDARSFHRKNIEAFYAALVRQEEPLSIRDLRPTSTATRRQRPTRASIPILNTETSSRPRDGRTSSRSPESRSRATGSGSSGLLPTMRPSTRASIARSGSSGLTPGESPPSHRGPTRSALGRYEQAPRSVGSGRSLVSRHYRGDRAGLSPSGPRGPRRGARGAPPHRARAVDSERRGRPPRGSRDARGAPSGGGAGPLPVGDDVAIRSRSGLGSMSTGSGSGDESGSVPIRGSRVAYRCNECGKLFFWEPARETHDSIHVI